jgi:phenylacetate-CoA ligase
LGDIYGAKVLSLLGQNEVGIAIPCEHNVLHLPNFAMFTEVYDEEGNEVENGVCGNSIVTPTWREAQPILRYVTGDVIRIRKDQCKCGLAIPTMEILGRKRTELDIGGRKIFPIEMEDILYRSPISGPWYQITVEADHMKVVVEHREKEQWKTLVDDIGSNFSRELKMDVRVEMVTPGKLYDYREMRPGKPLSRILDNVSGKDRIIEGA